MNDYLDPHVTSVNRLPAHARRYENRCISLNGVWDFCLYDDPEESHDFYRADADISGFSKIQVPGNWQLQGFGKPIYTNTVYPWPVDGEMGLDGQPDPWRIPKENPTGCYRRFFTLPEEAKGQRVLIRFDGVETAYELYVNGAFVGYGEDSKLAGEFDITDFVHEGENLLALRVYSFATSTYLEDQDYWYLNGIHRGVDLILVPAARIADFKVDAVLDRDGTGAGFRADVSVTRTEGFGRRKIRARLTDAEGHAVAEETASIAATAGYSQAAYPTAATARIQWKLDKVRKWSPDTPYLYRAVFEYLDEDGAVLDADGCRVGFKRVEIEDGILKINGQRALIFGVNRHEHAWKSGRAVSREHMIREIREMKRMNINAVRTCHYPDSVTWYDLCDEMGLLVLCECNLETHGVSGMISHDPAFAPVYVERAMRMVMQHKNHACIYGWSLGNESGFGPNHAAMYGLIKEYDKTRTCQYEAGAPGKNISDIRGNMYATEKEIMALLTDPRDDRPVILVEYCYIIRNCGGRMDKFIDLTRRYERFQGGFVWDWQDKSLPLPGVEDGFAHGGDFGESMTDPLVPRFMTNNGLVRADLAWKPVAYEVREAYAPLLIERAASDNAWGFLHSLDQFTVINRSFDRLSEEFAVTLEAVDGCGEVIGTRSMTVEGLKPRESRPIDLLCGFDGPDREPILFINVRVAEKDGREVSCRQFRIRDGILSLPRCPKGDAPLWQETADRWIVEAGASRAEFAKKDGMLLAYTVGQEKRVLGSSVCLDRPYCGLDADPGWGVRDRMDEARNTPITFEAPEIMTGKDRLCIRTAFAGGERLRGQVTWTVFGDGQVESTLDVQTATGLLLPRVGLEMTVPGDQTVDYTGYGPMENYPDRMVAARYGHYRSDVEGLGFQYAPPSENGGHEGTTRLAFQSGGRDSLVFSAEKPFHFDVHPYTVRECQQALHTHELPHHGELTVHLDACHAPIGGDMAWSTMLDIHDLPAAGFYSLRVRMNG